MVDIIDIGQLKCCVSTYKLCLALFISGKTWIKGIGTWNPEKPEIRNGYFTMVVRIWVVLVYIYTSLFMFWIVVIWHTNIIVYSLYNKLQFPVFENDVLCLHYLVTFYTLFAQNIKKLWLIRVLNKY